jgi:hypothetical protein
MIPNGNGTFGLISDVDKLRNGVYFDGGRQEVVDQNVGPRREVFLNPATGSSGNFQAVDDATNPQAKAESVYEQYMN